MEQADRDPALDLLEAFVGEWGMEAAFPGAPPTGPMGRTVFEWVGGEGVLLQRWGVAHPGAPGGSAPRALRRAQCPGPSPRGPLRHLLVAFPLQPSLPHLLAQPRHWIVLRRDHPLLQRDDPVVGDVDALRAHLRAALRDVAEPKS